jgi:glyoxylase-like metal-dependent hydrolase (beta-lactamase superfamily II)
MERQRVGAVEVVALLDTNFSLPPDRGYPGADLGPYAEFLVDGQMYMDDMCFLLVSGDRRILVDTGMGPEVNGTLLEGLDAAGVMREDIDTVAFTHLHGDHVGWNIDRESGAPLFANARYWVPQGDWDHYSAQGGASFVRDVQPLQENGQLELFEGEHAFDDAISSVATPGHTPGHTSFVIDSGGERGFVLGDVVLTAIDAAEPTFQNTFDHDHDLARETRIATLERLSADSSLVAAAHMLAPGFGRFVKTDGRHSWRAIG